MQFAFWLINQRDRQQIIIEVFVNIKEFELLIILILVLIDWNIVYYRRTIVNKYINWLRSDDDDDVAILLVIMKLELFFFY